MERVQKALDNDDFLWFLNNNYIYTNSPSYFEYIQDYINKANTGPSHHKNDYLRRALSLFNTYFKKFQTIFPSLLPSLRFSFSLFFPKRNYLLGWPYLETVRCKQNYHTKNTKNQPEIDLNAFLHDLINKPYKEIDQHKSRDDTHYYSLNQEPYFNPTLFYYKSQYRDSMSETIMVITFKFSWTSILQLIFNKSYASRKKKGRSKDKDFKESWCQALLFLLITIDRYRNKFIFNFIEFSFLFSFIFTFITSFLGFYSFSTCI
jgi:hypothetical protein